MSHRSGQHQWMLRHLLGKPWHLVFYPCHGCSQASAVSWLFALSNSWSNLNQLAVPWPWILMVSD